MGAAIEKARLLMLSLVLGTKRRCETDDVRFLGISEKLRRLTKQGGCCVERARCVIAANMNCIRYSTGSECNCLSRDSDGEKRWALKLSPF